MKKINIIFLLFAVSSYCLAQDKEVQNETGLPMRRYSTYLGTSSGINNVNGVLGAMVESQFGEKVTGIAGVGLGTWGVKGSGGLRFYKSYPQSLYYGIGLSFYSGIQDLTLNYTDPDTDQQNEVDVNFNGTSVLNLVIGFQWGITQDDRFRVNLEGGYSLPFKKEPYEIKTYSYQDDEYLNSLMELFSPGGLIISMGVSMGF